MPVANTLISANEFNIVRNKVNTVLGTGGGTGVAQASRGYGQPLNSFGLSTNQLVSQRDYDLLRFDIVNARVHQIGTGVSLVDVNEHQLISVSAINPYDTTITTADGDAERFKVAAGQFLTDSGTSTAREWSANTSPTTWRVEINAIIRMTFASTDQARWFFNTGGEIRINSTRSNPVSRSADTAQSTSWTTLLNLVGTEAFGGIYPAVSSGGVTRTAQNGFNFYNLTNTFSQFYRRDNTTPYTSNRYILEARTDVANTNGTATWLEIRIRFVDAYVDPPGANPGAHPPSDNVDGIFTITVSEKRADSSDFQPIMATTTTQDNSAARNTLRVPTTGVPFIRNGMLVSGSNVGVGKTVASTSTSGSDTIITLNENTTDIVAASTNISLQNRFRVSRPIYSISQTLTGS
jgi:hypothetical protein